MTIGFNTDSIYRPKPIRETGIFPTAPQTQVMDMPVQQLRRVFPSDVEYSGDIFEKQGDFLPEEELFTAPDGKKYSLKEYIGLRLGTALITAYKKKENTGFWGKLKEFFNIGNTFKKFDKIYGNNCEAFDNADFNNDLRQVFYDLTGFEYSAINAEKFLNGDIKLKAELAAERYIEKEIKPVAPMPYIPASYINQTTLTNMKNSRTELNEEETEKYEVIKNSVSPKYQAKLENALKNGQLLQDNSDNKTTVLESLHKILTTPRAENLDGRQIVEECIDILDNPYIITQTAEDIPESYQNECAERMVNYEMEMSQRRINDYNNAIADRPVMTAGFDNLAPAGANNLLVPPITRPIRAPKVITEEYARDSIVEPMKGRIFPYRSLGTCSAASIEYYLAAQHSAQFFSMVEGLTAEQKCFIKNIDSDWLSRTENRILLNMFKVDEIQNENCSAIRVTADKNAYLLAQIQTKHKDEGERSIVDIIMQSAIMNLGSRGTYESISDRREPNEYTEDNSGLILFENSFVLRVLTDDNIDECRYKEYNQSANRFSSPYNQNDIKNEILDALNKNGAVVAGYTWQDENGNIMGGHEITIIGYTTDMNGNGLFIIQDSDDSESRPVTMPEKELLQSIHHAFVEYKTEPVNT